MIELGNIVKDDLTGFQGKVIGKAKYLFEQTKVLVQPDKLQSDGKPTTSEWLSTRRVSLITEEKSVGFQPCQPCMKKKEKHYAL